MNRDFLHSNQNDARAFKAPMLWRILQRVGSNINGFSLPDCAHVSLRNYFRFSKNGELPLTYGVLTQYFLQKYKNKRDKKVLWQYLCYGQGKIHLDFCSRCFLKYNFNCSKFISAISREILSLISRILFTASNVFLVLLDLAFISYYVFW